MLPRELYRNSVGDEAIYLQNGTAFFESVYGRISAVAGDYIVIPRGTIHRWVPAAPGVTALVVAASGHIRPPRRYLSQYGQLLEHAPYSERDLRGPDGPLLAEGEDVPVIVRTRAGLTRLTYARHPFDVVGWDGYLYPFAFNIADFEPVVKRTHAPPPVHQTFEGPNFVICSFCPRPLDFDAAAVPIPYNHHNVDSDEMMFYVGGDYTARKGSGVGLGSITLHPSGFTHGPQPGAVEAAVAGLAEGKTTTDETAVMIDTFRPLASARRPAGPRTPSIHGAGPGPPAAELRRPLPVPVCRGCHSDDSTSLTPPPRPGFCRGCHNHGNRLDGIPSVGAGSRAGITSRLAGPAVALAA